jgi:hypothetical protein
MDNEHWKRGKKAYTRSPTLIYMTSCKKKIGERNHQKELPLMSKGERKNKIGEKYQKHEDRGREIVKRRYIIRGNYPFPLMSKGERKIRGMKIGGAMVTGGV